MSNMPKMLIFSEYADCYENISYRENVDRSLKWPSLSDTKPKKTGLVSVTQSQSSPKHTIALVDRGCKIILVWVRIDGRSRARAQEIITDIIISPICFKRVSCCIRIYRLILTIVENRSFYKQRCSSRAIPKNLYNTLIYLFCFTMESLVLLHHCGLQKKYR
ncbi:unnamed protein product [Trichogramma brassicae]|uniref:Uncharacterized protein n=1 Tax=Trichogramma brassicae TaxID=86971 RepID=A0A6H5IIT4_9HYME|nr:unnamed protein product [Trichogramma brassicae]